MKFLTFLFFYLFAYTVSEIMNKTPVDLKFLVGYFVGAICIYILEWDRIKHNKQGRNKIGNKK